MSHVENARIMVKADGEDLTPYVKKIELIQTEEVHREFKIAFAQHHTFSADAEWDIYASYDGQVDDEPLIRRGVVPADRPLTTNLMMGEVPEIGVHGYEYVWLSSRSRPDDSIILTHSRGRDSFRSAREALARRNLPLGRHTVRGGLRTLYQAVEYIGRLAGLRVRIRLQDYPFTTLVIGPETSYWDALTSLTDPFAPLMWYRRMDNVLMISDSVDFFQSAGTRLEVPPGVIGDFMATPRQRRRVPARIVIQFPAWNW